MKKKQNYLTDNKIHVVSLISLNDLIFLLKYFNHMNICFVSNLC